MSSWIISDADRVRQNTANKKELMLPKSRMDDTVRTMTSFGGRGTINCKKYEEAAKRCAYYQQKAPWR